MTQEQVQLKKMHKHITGELAELIEVASHYDGSNVYENERLYHTLTKIIGSIGIIRTKLIHIRNLTYDKLDY